MSKQVPESEQLQRLKEALAKYAVIRKYRGKAKATMSSFCVGLVEKTSSPTEFCSMWDAFSGEMRVIGNVLAQFRRDKMDTACAHLVKALEDPLHRFPFENRLPVPTKPITVIVLDPKRTFAMLRWLMLGHWMDLNSYLDGKSTPLSKILFKSFPTLEEHSLVRRKEQDYEGWDLERAFQDSITEPFEVSGGLKRLKSQPHCCLPLVHGQWNDHVEIGDQVFAYVVDGDQAAALSLFSRDEQKRIGSWQFDIPESLFRGKATFSQDLWAPIGFHLEGEHEAWGREYPDWVSTSVNHGWGAILFGNEGRGEKWSCKSLDGVSHYGWQSQDRLPRFRLRRNR